MKARADAPPLRLLRFTPKPQPVTAALVRPPLPENLGNKLQILALTNPRAMRIIEQLADDLLDPRPPHLTPFPWDRRR